MNRLKLKETMNQIHLGEEVQAEIMKNVVDQVAGRQQRIRHLKKASVTAAVFALIIGAAIPIQAGIRYLVNDRLEKMPKQELAAMRQMLQDQENVEADSISREYSDEERVRMQQLKKEYQNGKFPQHTIEQTDISSISEDSLSYISDTGTFHLPQRALTDEELLQIIDFQYTSDYALSQGNAAKQARESWALEERRLEEEIKDKNGITEQDAIKAAAKYLKSEFGVSAQNAQMDIFLDQEPYNTAAYHVSYEIRDQQSVHAYAIDINAEDGSLLGTSSASLP